MRLKQNFLFITIFRHFLSFLDFDQMGRKEFAEHVSKYFRSIDDKKTVNRVKAAIIKLMAENNPWETP